MIMCKRLLYLLLPLLAFCSCSKEDLEDASQQGSAAPQEKMVFVRLADNSTRTAGVLKFEADASEATLKWIVSDSLNLDTTQTVVKLTNGRGELPICWDKKLEDGTYGPKSTAFKAGVVISTESGSQSYPLVWSEKLDSVKFLSNLIRTRASGATLFTTNVLKFVPATVNMDRVSGATMVLVYKGSDDEDGITPFFVANYSEFNNVVTPESFYENTTISRNLPFKFKWENDTPSATSFEGKVMVSVDDGMSVTGTVKWNVTAPPAATLEVSPASHTIEAAGGNNVASSVVTTNQTSWTATSDQAWLRAAVNGASVSFSADPNTSTSSSRTATVTISTGGLSRTVVITQKAATPGTITSVTLLPAGNISSAGGTYTGTFVGTYTGTITMRAVTAAGVTLVESTGNVQTGVSVVIPALNAPSRTLTFQYHIGGAWINIEDRLQNGTASVGVGTVQEENWSTDIIDGGNYDLTL